MTSQAVLSGVAQDVFQPVGGLNPSYIPTRPDHPVPRTGIVSPFIQQHESRSNLVFLGCPTLANSDQQILCEFIPWKSESRRLDSSIFGCLV